MSAQYPVSLLCQVLQVSTSGYFAWRKRGHGGYNAGGTTRLSDQALRTRIRAIHAQVKGGYGWPRMHRQLQAGGVRVGSVCVGSCSSTVSVPEPSADSP